MEFHFWLSLRSPFPETKRNTARDLLWEPQHVARCGSLFRLAVQSHEADATLVSISGLVVEYVVAIDVTRVRFPADAF